ncbi:MAG: hypothetical protein AAFR68_04175 [Pseudomonadota bacterium]
MASKGDIRYSVDWAPDDMFSTVDEANAGMMTRVFSEFERAVTFALQRADSDFFGVVSIDREVCTSARYNQWEEDATWHVEADSHPLENEPDYSH